MATSAKSFSARWDAGVLERLVRPTRFSSWEFARLTKALARLLDTSSPGKSFVVWLQEG
jgi:hypothetical protein